MLCSFNVLPDRNTRCPRAAVVMLAGLFVRSRTSRPRVPTQACRETHSRAGFTLIELLVCMGVIALLIALLLPAVQSSREAARRTLCGNRLHQIGIALESFDSSHGRLPQASVLSSWQGRHLANNRSPHVGLLPYLDQTALYELYDRSERGSGINDDPPSSTVNAPLLARTVEVFICPSDTGDSPRCNYRICCGTSPGMHETIPRSPAAALQGYRGMFGRRDAEFRDGKSNTAAFSEKLSGDRDPGRYTPWRDTLSLGIPGLSLTTPDEALQACGRPVNPNPMHFSFGGSTWVLSGYPQTWYNHVLTPNSRIPDCTGGSPLGNGAFAARSLHPGGVNVLFADGRVRFVANGIDLDVWRALGSVDGGESVSID